MPQLNPDLIYDTFILIHKAACASPNVMIIICKFDRVYSGMSLCVQGPYCVQSGATLKGPASAGLQIVDNSLFSKYILRPAYQASIEHRQSSSHSNVIKIEPGSNQSLNFKTISRTLTVIVANGPLEAKTIGSVTAHGLCVKILHIFE